LSEPLPITNSIQSRFVERKWMRSAKAWRCFLDIPSDGQIPEVLTALLETQVCADIVGDGITVKIDPAYIVDVPSKKKQFQVVLETVYENQSTLGPRLTALTDQAVTLSILPRRQQATNTPTPEPENTLNKDVLRGLHITFFQNPKFWEWLSTQTGETIGNPLDCKEIFKAWLQVSSCKDIETVTFREVVARFNDWLNGRNGA